MGAISLLIKLLGFSTAGVGLASAIGLGTDKTGTEGAFGWLGTAVDFVKGSLLDKATEALGTKGTSAEGASKVAMALMAVGTGAFAMFKGRFGGGVGTGAWMYPMLAAAAIGGVSLLSPNFNAESGLLADAPDLSLNSLTSFSAASNPEQVTRIPALDRASIIERANKALEDMALAHGADHQPGDEAAREVAALDLGDDGPELANEG